MPIGQGRQFSIRADGYGSPMPSPTPTATKTPTPKPTPSVTPTPKPKKLYVGSGGMPEYKPVGSGNSAAVGGFLGGGGGAFGSML